MSDGTVEYVTAQIGGQLFGLPIGRVQDVFVPDRLTRVPLAAPEIAGLISLRGRIITLLDMRHRLGFAAAGLALQHADRGSPRVALGVEHKGESYGLLVDEIGEVMKLPAAGREHVPINMHGRLARLVAGVHRLDRDLLVVLDVDRVLDLEASVSGGAAWAAQNFPMRSEHSQARTA
jgi:purine-binding chemotaxis protein CheW